MRINPARIDLPPEMLGKLLDTASACAFALLVVGADQFIISQGELSQKGLHQMLRALHKYWPASAQHDLNRYVGLNLDERFYFLFAKFLPESDILLSLLFTPYTPWVRIRQDMTNVMRRVLGHIRTKRSDGQDLERSLQFVLKPHPAPDPKGHVPSQPAAGRLEIDDQTQWVKEEPVPEQMHPNSPDELPEWRPVRAAENLQSPSPNPSLADSPTGEVWTPIDDMLSTTDAPPPEVKSVQKDTPGISVPSSPSEPAEKTSTREPREWQSLEEAPQPESDLVRLFHDDLEPYVLPSARDDEILPEDIPDEAHIDLEPYLSKEETRPHIFKEDEEFDQIKLSDITFYLVPRLNRQFIIGELAQRLREWFPVFCETYGWQLDLLSVRPDYIKWRLHDFPDALIYEMLEIVRKRTSERIFRVFPNLQEGNPTDDFWSPGYLVDRQNQDFSTQVLITHVKPDRHTDQED